MARSSTTFAPGHTVSVKHGAHSPRLVRTTVQVKGRRLRRELEQRSEAPLRRLAVDLEARLSLVGDYLDAHGGSLLNRRGRVRGCASLYLALASRLVSVYDRLQIGRQPAEDDGDALAALIRGSGNG